MIKKYNKNIIVFNKIIFFIKQIRKYINSNYKTIIKNNIFEINIKIYLYKTII